MTLQWSLGVVLSPVFSLSHEILPKSFLVFVVSLQWVNCVFLGILRQLGSLSSYRTAVTRH